MNKKPKKKIKKSEPKVLFIDYTETREGGEPDEPDNQWSDHSPIDIYVKFNFLLREQNSNKMFYHSVEVDEKTFKSQFGFLAVIRYSDGDTFGSSSGNWEVIGCAPSHKIAEVMIDVALKEPGFKSWNGYFSSFERSEIICLPISD